VRGRADLFGYQRRSVGFIRQRRFGALLIDMGLGKTIIALTAIVDLLSRGDIGSVLVVAPVRVIQAVWRQEALLWSHTRKLRFALVHGKPAERIAALRTPAHVHLINPEGVKWLAQVMKKRAWPWDMLIVDESTEFAVPNTVRFRMLRKGLRHFKRRYVMTGTPTPRSLLQLWSQMFIADLGASLGQRYTDYKTNHFYKTGYKGYKLEPKDGSEDTIVEAMSRRVVRLAAEDWLDLPEVITTPVWVELPPNARELYDRIEEEMFLQFESQSMEDGDEEAVAETAASLSIKCRQIANGAIFTRNMETGERSWRPIHDAKVDALREIVAETYGARLLVPYQFKHDIERILSAFPDFVGFDKNRVEEIVEEWNNRRIPGLVLHPSNSKYGLNLQMGGHRIAWFGGTFSRLGYDQMIGRLRRMGQKYPVYNYIILARSTVDEAVLAALEGHGARQHRISEAFKFYYQQRLKEKRNAG
jgi:SNF2 family DNA or RNA helicase